MRSNTLLLAAVLATSAAWGQEIVSAKAGLIHLIEGEVFINGNSAVQAGDKFLSLKEGETLSTEAGRAEVLLNAGSYLRIGDNSSFKLVSADLENTQLTLLSGTVLIEVAELPKDTSATIEVMGSQAALRKRGLYEFTADKPGNVRVYDGELTLTASGAAPIKIAKGREIAFNALSAGPGKFDETLTSSLYNWGSRRALYIARVNEAAAKSAYTSGYGSSNSLSNLTLMSLLGRGYSGIWLFNPMFGTYTYLPLRGYGYSPFGIQIYSPQTAYARVYQPATSGFDSGSQRSAVSSSAYAGAAVSSGGGAVSVPAATAPAVSTPNTGGGGEAGRRR
ncbi:MAG: FecR domain-containing protein [Bryobacteraceae bacterium]